MLTVKEAVRTAMDLLNDLYDTRKFEDILLEAVEMAADGRRWQVTVGFSRKALFCDTFMKPAPLGFDFILTHMECDCLLPS